MAAESEFTCRMRQICEDAATRCPGYHPTRFLQMVEGCGGDFVPTAKRMLVSGEIQKGLWTLAKHRALDISMEAIVLETPWRENFTADELGAAEWRLSEAKRRIEAGEGPDSSEW